MAKVTVIKDTNPVGTNPIKHVVTEEVKPRKGIATFKSCDCEIYSLPTHTSAGKPLPEREMLCILTALREIALGGNPGIVLDAFKVKITDLNGKEMFPLKPEELKNNTSFSMGDVE